MLTSDHFTVLAPAHFAPMPRQAAKTQESTVLPREDARREAWQLGLDLFCAAAGARSVGIVVLHRESTGHRVIAELGCAERAHQAWQQDIGGASAADDPQGSTEGWRRIQVGPAVGVAATADPQASLWGCKLFDAGTYCAYIGLESDRLLTDKQLQLLVSHMRRYCRALEKDLWLAPWMAASPSPTELAGEASRQFGLTPAEEMVLRELLSGAPAKRIATRRGVEVNTIRSQIKSIYGKLDVHRACEIYARLRQHGAAARMN